MNKLTAGSLMLMLTLTASGCSSEDVPKVDDSYLPPETFAAAPSYANLKEGGDKGLNSGRYDVGTVLDDFPSELPDSHEAHETRGGKYVVTKPGEDLPPEVKADLRERVSAIPDFSEEGVEESGYIVATWYDDISERTYLASKKLPIFVWEQNAYRNADDKDPGLYWHAMWSTDIGRTEVQISDTKEEAEVAAEEWKKNNSNAGDIYVLGEVE